MKLNNNTFGFYVLLISFPIVVAYFAHVFLLLARKFEGMPKKELETDSFKTFYPEENWGTYYDPKEIFCGEYDCYKILDFDHETWGKLAPTRKDLTHSYRHMSKIWHPDKNKDKGAKDRFMRINKAYEVLTNPELRKEYDYMRERPDDYFKKYGSKILYYYAPKSNTTIVVFILCILGSSFTWFAQKQKWQYVANKVIKDATNGLKSYEGASLETIHVKQKAETILKIQKEKEMAVEDFNTNNRQVKSGSNKAKNRAKMNKKELKQKQKEDMSYVIIELVNDIDDFGAGFHQPRISDMLLMKLLISSIKCVKR